MRRWMIWVLSREDIEFCCQRMGIPFSKLSKEQKQDIAYYFKKGFEAGCESWWEECLEDAIRLAVPAEWVEGGKSENRGEPGEE